MSLIFICTCQTFSFQYELGQTNIDVQFVLCKQSAAVWVNISDRTKNLHQKIGPWLYPSVVSVSPFQTLRNTALSSWLTTTGPSLATFWTFPLNDSIVQKFLFSLGNVPVVPLGKMALEKGPSFPHPFPGTPFLCNPLWPWVPSQTMLVAETQATAKSDIPAKYDLTANLQMVISQQLIRTSYGLSDLSCWSWSYNL